MSIRRWSLWLPNGLLMVIFLTGVLLPPYLIGVKPRPDEVFSYAGTFTFMVNIFMPLVGGILAADRLVRDSKNGVDELLRITPLPRWSYLLGKYLGVLASVCLPALLTDLAQGGIMVVQGVSPNILAAMTAAFAGINLPAYAFVVAFSLVCPLFLPVRVYQVLFTGYWFWGNYLSPEVIPTLNGTLLFGDGGPNYIFASSPTTALANFAVLALCAALALLGGERILNRRSQRA
jgi:hypothetical protein